MSRAIFVPVGGRSADAASHAAAWLLATGERDRPAVLVEVGGGEPMRSTLVGSADAARLGRRLAERAEGRVEAATRGRLCWVSVPAEGAEEGEPEPALEVRALVEAVPDDVPLAVVCGPRAYRALVEELGERLERSFLVLGGIEPGSPLVCLASEEAEEAGLEVEARAARLGLSRSWLSRAGVGRGGPGSAAVRAAGEEGQATPLVLGGIFVLVVAMAALVAIAGAINGKARAQGAADLAALSAARSMKQDLPRLLSPPRLPNGLPNPAHMSKATYLARARSTALRIGIANGASPRTLRIAFPDRLSFAPVRARVSVVATAEAQGRAAARAEHTAEAEVGVLPSLGAVPAVAAGGGYSGPLAERQGHGMRPDVAAAFDRMAAAAASAGVSLVINSAFRSDAEQAALFAANPDPTWVAPPGTSLHRCGTELDLGPPSAYGWLAANASRFGFVQRYSWEPWHYGLSIGPPPCSKEADLTGGMDRSQVGSASLPSFVPARFRGPLLSAAARWGVSAALLAAQLLAESNFDPQAVSPVGAQGIAQFMPSTAAAYGLRDPFDPEAAIEAQAHLMSDLLKQFGSPALALAAYNAGPGAVGACDCVPDYPETQAYVARIMSLVGGAAALAGGGFEVRLVD